MRSADGDLKITDHESLDEIHKQYEQIGIDDCSTDLSLRGMPVFRGLVGPIPESKAVARYETPEVFELLTKEWSKIKTKRRRRKSSAPVPSPAMLNVDAPSAAAETI